MNDADRKLMMSLDSFVTTVVDAGARYGMHPTWTDFGGDLAYFAFEPDPEEAERLRRRPQPPGFEVLDMGLASTAGIRELRLAKHRGCSSFLPAEMNSEWFERYRPGEGATEAVLRIPTCTVDEFASSRGLRVDFLKVDTEGTELEVLEGAEHELGHNTLALRVGVSFQSSYRGQALFSDIQTYLSKRDFFLLNLDYFGRGCPRNGLFRNPDPLLPDQQRYGVLVGTDAVWLKDFRRIRTQNEFAFSTLKYAYFCLLNHAPDVGVDALLAYVRGKSGGFDENVRNTNLYRSLRRACARFLGQWRTYPDAHWEEARAMFKEVFGIPLDGGHRYWELIQSL